jgi:Bacterial regulatory protein, arsR family
MPSEAWLIGAREGGEVRVCDLISAFNLSQPTISHHLKVLREAGLIDSERRGAWVYYRLVPAALERMAGLLSVPVGWHSRRAGTPSANKTCGLQGPGPGGRVPEAARDVRSGAADARG